MQQQAVATNRVVRKTIGGVRGGVDEAVKDDVEKLFTSNSYDAVLRQSLKLKQEIQGTQDQLRQLVGSRYKELLASCDMIVGMRTVCGDLINLQPTAASINNNMPRNSGRAGSGSRSDVDAAPAVIVSEEHQILFRHVHSIRTLLDQGYFVEASFGTKQARTALATLKDSIVIGDTQTAALFGSANYAVDSLPMIIRTTISKAFSELAAESGKADENNQGGNNKLLGSPTSIRGGDPSAPRTTALPTSTINRLYADAHAAIELLDGCSQLEGLEVLVTMHVDLIRSLCSQPQPGTNTTEAHDASACSNVLGLMSHCLLYLSSCSGTGLTPALPATRAMPLENLLELDPSSPDYLSTLTLQVCGLNAFGSSSRTSVTKSALEGWAMSPPAPQRLQIPATLTEQITTATEAALCSLIERLSSVDSIATFESILPVLTSSWESRGVSSLFNAKSWIAKIHKAVSAHLQRCIKTSLAPLTTLVQAACDDAIAAVAPASSAQSTAAAQSPSKKSTASLLSSAEALTELVRRKVRGPTQGAAVGSAAGGGSGGGGFQKQLLQGAKLFATALKRPTMAADDVALLVELALEWLGQTTQSLHNAVQKKNQAATTGSSNGSKDRTADQLQQEFALSKVANAITALAEALETEFTSAKATSASTFLFQKQLTQVEALYLECQQCWISKFSVDVDASLQKAVQALPVGVPPALLKLHYADSWTSHQAEGAVVHCPSNATAAIAKALLDAQQSIATHTQHPGGKVGGGSTTSSSSAPLLRAVVFPKVSEALNTCLGKYINKSLKQVKDILGDEAPAEILMQLYFDANLIQKIYSCGAEGGARQKAEAPSAAAFHSLMSQIDQFVETVDWSLSQDYIDASVVSIAEGSTLSMGCGRSSHVANSNSQDLLLGRGSGQAAARTIAMLQEAPRLTLLPLEGLTGISSSLRGATGPGGAMGPGTGAGGAIGPGKGDGLGTDPKQGAATEALSNISKGIRSVFAW